MNKNKHSWNETLKFSWGHIIAFLALFFLGYISFMGDFYLRDGDFKSAGIKTGVLILLVLATFIGTQFAKAAERKFGRFIVVERILIVLSIVIFIIAMIPYNHFWNVFKNRNEIEREFKAAIVKSERVFVVYNEYAKNRINSYENGLTEIVSSKSKERYRDFGFSANLIEFQKEANIETLMLQLDSENKKELEKEARKWIQSANMTASVWNAFLVGNIDVISDAIKDWHKTLFEFSEPVLINEKLIFSDVLPFDSNQELISGVLSELNSLKHRYNTKKGVNFLAVLTGMVLYVMLLLPYLLQSRNTRAAGYYSLIPIGRRKHLATRGIEDIDGNNFDNDFLTGVDKDENHSDDRGVRGDNDVFSGTF